MKNKKIFLISLIMLVIMLSLVATVSAESIFDNIFGAIAGDKFDMGNIYSKYGSLIDLIIYLILFIGISQATIGKHFEGRGGKAVVVAIGIALSISLAYWGSKNNFNLGSFGWLAGAVFMLVLFYAIYQLLKTMMGAKEFSQKALPAFLGFIIVWYTAQAVAPSLMKKLVEVPIIGPLMPGVVSLCLVAVLILGGMKLVGKFKSVAPAPSGVISNEVGKLDKAGKEGKKEGAVDQLETKEEKKIIKTLKGMDEKLDKLIMGKDTVVALKGIENDLLGLREELKKLRDLQINEKAEENVRKSLGIKSGNKLYKLLAEEQSFIEAFYKLIEDGINYLNTDKPKIAKERFDKARAVLNQLIKINRKERREL